MFKMATGYTEPVSQEYSSLKQIVHTIYERHLQGLEFQGKYEGSYVSHKTGTQREMVGVIGQEEESFYRVEDDLYSQNVPGVPGRHWKGFTTASDSFKGYNWKPQIFARSVSTEDGAMVIFPAAGWFHRFVISKVIVYDNQQHPYWPYGVIVDLHLTQL